MKGRRGRQAGVLVALLLTAALLPACGSRLAPQQEALAQQAEGGGGLGGAAGGGTGSSGGLGGSGSLGGAAGTAAALKAGGKGGGGGVGSAGGAGGAAGSTAPAGGNGGATDTGVTATTITVGNIASISGVAPGLTQSAQQATEAWAAYVNSQGGIFGRQIKVVPYDDGNDSGTNFQDATQACSSAFAMVGNASGFDDGGAQAISQCGIPSVAAEVSTTQAGEAATQFGASPGNAHYWGVGPALYLKSKYGSAVTKAAMIYLNVPATQSQATHEMAAYSSVGFNYIYTAQVTPTEPNYAPYVLQMQQKGVQYVTEYSDASSAERLLQAMQAQNYQPQVVDWFSEEYSPDFISQTQGESNGNLVLMSATAAYEEAGANPGMQLFLQWLNRVAPGAHHDIFGILAWSAGLAFEQAAKAVGPHLTRAALVSQLQQIHNWTGGGVTPPVDLGNKIPSPCFFYLQIQGGGFQRAYPSGANTYDCSGGLFHY